MTSLAVDIKTLSKSYGSKVALHNINFSIAKNKIVAILGQNGAGKTTLINCLLGLQACRAEQLSLLDYELGYKLGYKLGQQAVKQQRPAVLRNQIGVMMQMGNLNALLTVAEQLDLFCSYYTGGYSPSDLNALLSLQPIWHKRFGKLSGGQRQLVLFAIALIPKPKLLFLDEPSAGMDIEVRQLLWQHIRTLRDNGCTVVLTTHYIEEAERLADQIIMLHHGKIIADATLADFTADHSSLEHAYLQLIRQEAAHG